MANLNILSQRYATEPINNIFSEAGKTIAERGLWIAVMKAQKKLGVDIPSEDIEKFEAAKEDVDLDRIEKIERETKHDVNAKIQAFIETANAGEYIHMGMTSRDLTDNVEQIQIRKASEIMLGKYVSILRHFADKADKYKDIVLTARTHHQAAQPTLLGRRFSMWGEELLKQLICFEYFIAGYTLRGIKGAVGTQADMITLLGSREKAGELDRIVAREFGFVQTLNSPGQVYPRSFDYSLISGLVALASSSESFAKTMRLMAGYDLATEGFKKGQVGSSAMPHKMNTRSSERINGLGVVLKGYLHMASALSGDQWEEGDVSCSVVRRVMVPDSFYASDGLCETTLTVLNKMGVYEAVIDAETDRYLPFLATSNMLMIATEAGIGREQAHKLIKNYAVAEALRMKEQGSTDNNLTELVAGDPVFIEHGITKERIKAALSDRANFLGAAYEQIDRVREEINAFIEKYPEKAKYEPGDIL